MEVIQEEGLVFEETIGGDPVLGLVLVEKQVEKGLPGVDKRLEVRGMKNQMGSRGCHLQSMNTP